jgi:spermidine synthase
LAVEKRPKVGHVSSVKAWTTLARAPGLEGQELVLQERDGTFVVRSGGRELMSNARHHSEAAMARVGLERVRAKAPVVLVGGLGLGFTARAALDALPSGGRVVVAEISPAVVEWNRTLVAELAGRPLEDPRTEVIVGDVAELMRKQPGAFDCLLIDVDNGPSAMSARSNQPLFQSLGFALMKSALRPDGVLVVWSAGPDAQIEKLMGKAGFETRVERSSARDSGGAAYVLFVGTLSGARRRPAR